MSRTPRQNTWHPQPDTHREILPESARAPIARTDKGIIVSPCPRAILTVAVLIAGIVFSIIPAFRSVCAADDVSARKIIIGADDTTEPYTFMDKSGKPSGFCIELLRAVGSVTGLDYEVRLGSWDKVRADLESGKIDAVAAMVYSEDRGKLVDFTPPYTVMHHSVFRRPDAPEVRWEEDLMGKDIVVVRGTIMHDYLLEKDFTASPTLVDSSEEALRLLHEGKHDYAILPKLSAVYWAEKLGFEDIATTGSPLGPSQLCFAVRKGDKELLARLTEGLAIVNTSGRQREIYDEWFGPLDLDIDAETLGVPVKVGVLADEGIPACHARWGLTADYLTEEIKGFRFEIVPLDYDQVIPAVASGSVDFVMTNPGQYVESEVIYKTIALTTLKNMAAGSVTTECSGVVFYRRSGEIIDDLGDLRGKTVAAVNSQSFAGWIVALREFKDQGVDPYRDLKGLEFLGSSEAVVQAVADGRVDVGIVRSGVLEQMSKEGKIWIRDFRVVKQWKMDCDSPFGHSTRCYPEWAFAALKNTSTELSERVAAALMDMENTDPSARSANCAGWTVPSNYGPVHECLMDLRMGPYRDYGKVSLADVWRQYWIWILGGIALILAMGLVAVYVVRLNRGLVNTVSERVKAEEALKESQEALREEAVRRRVLIEQSSDGIVVLDMDGGVYEANRKFAEMLGYTQEEVLELHAWDWDAVKPKEVILGMLRDVDETGINFETVHLRKDGWTFPVEVSSSGTIFGDQKLVFAVHRDITERKKAEQELVSHHEFLHTLVETIPIPVFCKDADLNFTICNKAFENFYGMNREDVIGKTVFEVAPHEIAESCDLEEKQLMDNPGCQRYEKLIPTTSGESRSVILSKASIMDSEGRSTGLVGVISDVTGIKKAETELKHRAEELELARKSAEENASELEVALNDARAAEEKRREVEEQFHQAQKMESLGLLAGGVAHDFNNILQGILGHTALIKSAVDKASDAFQHVRDVETAAYRAGELTQQLLSFARKGKYNVASVKPTAIIDEVAGFLRRTFNENVDILTEYDEDIHSIAGDSSQIHQAIMNLCINAGHAMPDGGVLTIRAENVTITPDNDHGVNEANPGEYVMLTFQDTGIGMDEDTLGRIFEPFFTTKGSGKGTGLGLSMVFGVVKNHGGIIDVDSTPGEGTTFKLLFPREQAVEGHDDREHNDDSVMANILDNELPEEDMTGKKALVVDDEEVIRTVAPRMLKKMGLESLCASSGEEAVKIYREKSPEIGIVILDMKMRGMGGLQTFRKLRKINPLVRVIISSGYDEDRNTQQVMREGALLFLKKPYPLETLLAAVRVATGSRETAGGKV